mmetsp:Transcript_17479/g.48602  ORF Transcript_17479/g.48602 Transcript_17479/m.48602 type:complete len:288 (+) Transcript_17479:6131-6994(+)
MAQQSVALLCWCVLQRGLHLLQQRGSRELGHLDVVEGACSRAAHSRGWLALLGGSFLQLQLLLPQQDICCVLLDSLLQSSHQVLGQARASHSQLAVPLQQGKRRGVQAAHQLLHHPIQWLQVACQHVARGIHSSSQAGVHALAGHHRRPKVRKAPFERFCPHHCIWVIQLQACDEVTRAQNCTLGSYKAQHARSWRNQRHQHLHHLHLSIGGALVDVGPRRRKVAHELAWGGRDELGGVSLRLQQACGCIDGQARAPGLFLHVHNVAGAVHLHEECATSHLACGDLH